MKKLIIIISALILMSGCATTTVDLINRDNMEIWQVNEPIETVFRVYKSHAEDMSRSLPYTLRAGGYFYGDSAEYSFKTEGIFAIRATYLHFQFDEDSGKTQVKVWYHNKSWRRKAEEFKALFETEVIK